MKVFENESEKVQRIINESLALLNEARAKLGELEADGVIQVYDEESAESIMQAEYDITAAEKWLVKEKGTEHGMVLRAVP